MHTRIQSWIKVSFSMHNIVAYSSERLLYCSLLRQSVQKWILCHQLSRIISAAGFMIKQTACSSHVEQYFRDDLLTRGSRLEITSAFVIHTNFLKCLALDCKITAPYNKNLHPPPQFFPYFASITFISVCIYVVWYFLNRWSEDQAGDFFGYSVKCEK